MTLPLIETPRYFTPESMAAMQKHFAQYWRIVRRPNQWNPRITEVVLVRGPRCPFHVKPSDER